MLQLLPFENIGNKLIAISSEICQQVNCNLMVDCLHFDWFSSAESFTLFIKCFETIDDFHMFESVGFDKDFSSLTDWWDHVEWSVKMFWIDRRPLFCVLGKLIHTYTNNEDTYYLFCMCEEASPVLERRSELPPLHMSHAPRMQCNPLFLTAKQADQLIENITINFQHLYSISIAITIMFQFW